MKGTLLSVVLALSANALAQDITFTNRTASFTNLQGAVYSNVTLVRADLDASSGARTPAAGAPVA